jgi:hypothetical protein
MRTALLLLSALSYLTATAQNSPPPKVVKDEAKPMTLQPLPSAAPILDRPGEERMTWKFAGDFDVPPAHPKCAELVGEPRKSCTAQEVLTEIKTRLKAVPPATLPPASVRIVVDFDVDQYGDVKRIGVVYAGDQALANQIIVALYGLPKFNPATKEGARAVSHCTFDYSPALLFAKDEDQGVMKDKPE